MINLKNTVARYEKQLVLWALRQTGGNQAEASRLLSITERSMWYLVAKHHITLTRTVTFSRRDAPAPHLVPERVKSNRVTPSSTRTHP